MTWKTNNVCHSFYSHLLFLYLHYSPYAVIHVLSTFSNHTISRLLSVMFQLCTPLSPLLPRFSSPFFFSSLPVVSHILFSLLIIPYSLLIHARFNIIINILSCETECGRTALHDLSLHPRGLPLVFLHVSIEWTVWKYHR